MTDQIQKLRGLARQCMEFQEERSLSDSAFFRKVPEVGSTKTYKRILDEEDDLEGLNVERQIQNYEAAIMHIETLRASDREPEPEYQDFSNIENTLAAVRRAKVEESIMRVVVIEGENGTGKDAGKNAILKEFPLVAVEVEATELWRNSKNEALGDIIAALGIIQRKDKKSDEKKLPMWPAARLRAILDELEERDIILIINEAHHMGPEVLNLMKTLVNKTRVVLVLECIPRLMKRLENANYEEAIQLFGNRLCERVVLKTPPMEEIALLLERRKIKFDSITTRDAAVQKIHDTCHRFGNWSFVKKMTRQLRKENEAITIKKFTAALSIIRKRCGDPHEEQE